MTRKVLIVDDNSTNLYMLETLLKGYGLEVTSAENGKEALDKARLDPPDLIVTDILMPVMDGYALCREWKSEDTLKHIPLVFYTATYTESNDEKFALSLGADRFIIKPQEPDVFMSMLKDVLEEKYTARQVVKKPLGEEMEFFRQHNEILFKKLEKKMLDLETANQKLKILEEQYRLSFENVMDVIYTVDTNLNVLSVSPSVEKILGYKPQDFIGRPVSDLADILTPESFEQAVTDRGLILRGDKIQAAIYRFIAKDGTIKYGEVSGSPVIREGRIIGIISVARDITDRRRAEEELQRINAFLDSIVENIPNMIFLKDARELRFIRFNRAGEDLLGYSRDDLLGKNDYDLFPKEQADSFTEKDRDVLRRKELVDISEERLQTRKKGERILQTKKMPILNAKGKPEYLLGISEDITERRQAERALAQRQAMLARTENIARIGSWEWDVATDTVIWSDELFRIFQRDPVGGAPSFAQYTELYHPDDAVRWRETVESAVVRGTPYELELRLLRQDGTVRHCLNRGYPEKGVDGKVVRLHGSLQDITEFKLAQERIEHLNNVLRSIRDINQLIIHERDRDTLIREGCRLLVDNRGYTGSLIVLTDENDRPVSWTGAGMEASSGPLNAMLERGELPPCCELTRSVKEVLLIKDQDSVCSRCPNAALHTGADTMCVRLINDDDAFGYLAVVTERSLEVDSEERSLFAEMAGDLAYALRVFQMDKSREKIEREHKSLQSQMIQAQKMESVGRLAGGVAHDYNNMLGVIIGYAEMAMDKTDPNDPLHADLREILSAARHSTDITRKLLAFARKQTISPRVLDLNEIVESMFKMLRRLIGENIELAWLPKASLWPVKIDPSQIDQILANLCVNARDAIGGVGKITIETDRVTFDEAHCADHDGFLPGDFLLLAVSDNGCGMDKETLESIFEPFFTTKHVGQGTGLGLATVYGIVKQNNGFINVYSEPGKGTTFKIYLPRHWGEVEEAEEENLPEIPLSRGETVLLVEDEPAIMKMGERMLEKLGYRVLAAGTPGEALRLAGERQGGIHLLITDVIMPEMNGHDLAGQLNNLYPNIKTLFMSGYTAEVIAHHGVLKKGVQFIQKPFSKKDLAVKVREVLG